MTDTPKLLPCPFCGGSPRLSNVEMAGCYYVVCTDCRAQGDDMSQDGAIAAWNRRHDAAVSAASKEGMLAAAEMLWTDKDEEEWQYWGGDNYDAAIRESRHNAQASIRKEANK